MEVLKENPFVILTPDDREEEITNAEVVHKLFVNVFEDFTSIPQQGHVFLNGPRGSGKSMMFRYLLPDCQLIEHSKFQYNELPFYSIHIPIKLTSINNPEYELVRDYGNVIFNEHVLTIYFAELIFDSFTKLSFGNTQEQNKVLDEIKSFYKVSFSHRLKLCGWDNTNINFNPTTVLEGFEQLKNICSDIFVQATQYLKRNVQNLRFPSHFPPIPYQGPLCDYLTFLFPLIKALKKISLFPDKPFFLLVDDADNLTETQSIVLNTWVSYRTNSEVSLKISTQLNYKTYNTINGTNIDSPHDYYDINILTVYSSSKDIYNKRMRQIIQKRLEYFFDVDSVNPDDFFPSDKNQDIAIESEKELIRKEYDTNGRGFRENDDVQRYAIPNYIKKLKGASKSGHTYKYSGFDQLVSISSGIIRHFLTPAAKMFNSTLRDLKLDKPQSVAVDVKFIPPSIQNKEIREYSTKQLFDEYDKLKKDKIQIEKDKQYLTKINKLKNLIEGLGGLFHEYLISERSERRVFSFAISGEVDVELLEIIDLGVRFGFFHRSTIGKKKNTGKTRLYILSRILAPHFLLDPTSFAGYKFFTSEKLLKALSKPDAFIQELSGLSESEDELIDLQTKLIF